MQPLFSLQVHFWEITHRPADAAIAISSLPASADLVRTKPAFAHGKEAEKADGEKAEESKIEKKQNFAGMDTQALMNLRSQVDEALTAHRSIPEKHLAALGSSVASFAGAALRERRSSLKGRKVAAKYRSPEGETWAGRGAKPKQLIAAINGEKISLSKRRSGSPRNEPWREDQHFDQQDRPQMLLVAPE